MNAERWLALRPHLERLLELDEAARARRLAELRASDPALASELLAALRAFERLDAERFLDAPLESLPAEATLAGQRFGAYTAVSPLGQGGMGSVWLARRSDGRFEGVAALKLLSLAFVGRAGEERFRREGSILARLAHLHIAHLIDAGVTAAGQPYLVLELVEGESIDRHCDRLRLDVAARVRLFLDVLDGVAHAHAHLVVHRDLKPSNVLVSHSGRVKLLDFGIAKLLEGEGAEGAATALTREAGRALTPAFAAPEQLTGGNVTVATDVYALGGLLYLLLSGRHPAQAATGSPAELVRAIVENDPPKVSQAFSRSAKRSSTVSGAADHAVEPAVTAAEIAAARATTPERLARQLKGDLETIVAKALRKLPAERYSSVAAMADDLRRYLEHRPIAARPESVAYRAAKFVRRHRLPAALAVAALVALTAGVAGTVVQAREARRQAARAAAERDRALRELARSRAVSELDSFLLSDAAASGRPFRVGDLLARAEKMIAARKDLSADLRAELLLSVGRQYESLDQLAHSRPLLEEAYALSRGSADAAIRAETSCALAASASQAGDLENAEKLLAEGIAELSDDPRFGPSRIFCLLRGGELARGVDDGARAVALVEEAGRRLDESEPGSALVALRVAMDRAAAYRVAGDKRRSERAFAEAYGRLEALGLAETETAGSLYNNRALALMSLGRPLEAETLLRRAIALSSSAGDDATASPMPFVNLSRVLVELGRYAEAADSCARGYSQARRVGNDVARIFALFAWSQIETRAGYLAEAGRRLDELEAALRKRYPDGRHLHFAIHLAHLGVLQQARGELARARESMDRAIALVDASEQRTSSLPTLLLYRSNLALAQGDAEPARADAQLALDLESANAGADAVSFRLGRARVALGRALAALGRRDEAAAAYAAGVALLEPTLGADCPETVEAHRLVAESAAR